MKAIQCWHRKNWTMLAKIETSAVRVFKSDAKQTNASRFIEVVSDVFFCVGKSFDQMNANNKYIVGSGDSSSFIFQVYFGYAEQTNSKFEYAATLSSSIRFFWWSNRDCTVDKPANTTVLSHKGAKWNEKRFFRPKMLRWDQNVIQTSNTHNVYYTYTFRNGQIRHHPSVPMVTFFLAQKKLTHLAT